MNDLDLLKDFRSGLATGPEQEEMDASWRTLRARMGVGPDDRLVAHHRRPRRLVVLAAAVAALTVLAVVLSVVLPSGGPGGAHRAEAAVTFSTDGGYLVAVINDVQADGEELKAAFARHGLDITVELRPVSPSLVGKVIFEDGAHGIETLFDDQAGCTTPGGLKCPIGLRIPLNFTGHADIQLGRPGEPDETYVSANSAFAPGEALHCSGLYGIAVRDALPVLSGRGLTPLWRSDAQAGTIDPSAIGGWYISDAIPAAAGQVYIFVSPHPPPQPEPGTPIARYLERLDAGC